MSGRGWPSGSRRRPSRQSEAWRGYASTMRRIAPPYRPERSTASGPARRPSAQRQCWSCRLTARPRCHPQRRSDDRCGQRAGANGVAADSSRDAHHARTAAIRARRRSGRYGTQTAGRAFPADLVLPGPGARLIVPAGAGLEPGLWYESEPSWLTEALTTLGHPPLDRLLSEWPRPGDERRSAGPQIRQRPGNGAQARSL